MNKIDINSIKGDYLVNKGNPLINAKFSLTVVEQKFILAVLSLIQPTDTDINVYSVPIQTFYNLLNIESTNKYRDMKTMTARLMSRVIEINDNGKCLQTHWVSAILYKEGTIEIEISKYLKPYLLDLKKNFTSYYLKYVLKMKKKYSVRMYEIFRSKLFKKANVISYIQDFSELQDILQCNYCTYDFKRNVLIPSLKEINTLSDIEVEFSEIKKVKKTVAFTFTIYNKSYVELTDNL